MPPSVNHYMGYRAILKGGKPLAVPYKTTEAVSFQKEFSKILQIAVSEQGWDMPVNNTKNIITLKCFIHTSILYIMVI